MPLALVHFPDADLTGVNRLRARYDPSAQRIAPHITVIFPLPDAVDRAALETAVAAEADEWQPFPIQLKGARQSPDGFLFLMVEEGAPGLVHLNEELYATALLRPYFRPDLSYTPHVTLGAFVGENGEMDQAAFAQAYGEAQALNLDVRCLFDRLHLVTYADSASPVEVAREFPLGKAGNV